MLYNEMAIKQTFGGKSQKITPAFMSATKLKILAQKVHFCFTFTKKKIWKKMEKVELNSLEYFTMDFNCMVKFLLDLLAHTLTTQ